MAKSAGGGYTTRFDPLIQYWANWYNVPPRVLKSMLLQESGLDPNQRTMSRDGVPAVGIAQFRPGTAQELGINPTDPNQAIAGAAAYFRKGINQGLTNGNAQRLGVNPVDYGVMYYNGGSNEQHWGAPGSGVWAHRDAVGGHYASPDSALSRGLPAQPGVQLTGVDDRLRDIVQRAATYLPPGWHAEIQSGYREHTPENPESLHRLGQAVDVQLYDQDGRPVSNYQDPTAFRQYEQFAQSAKKVQSTLYPELDPSFAWGGYFLNRDRPHEAGKLPYGAMDLMHFSVGGETPAGGDWQGGLNAEGRKDFPGAVSVGMGPVQQYQLPAPRGTQAAAPGQLPRVQVASAGVSDLPTGGGAPRPPDVLPANWADLPGAPVSMRAAPPSLYTATTPQEQTRWQQASTPRGYAAMQRDPQAATMFPDGGGPSVVPVSREALPPPLPERKPPVPVEPLPPSQASAPLPPVPVEPLPPSSATAPLPPAVQPLPPSRAAAPIPPWPVATATVPPDLSLPQASASAPIGSAAAAPLPPQAQFPSAAGRRLSDEDLARLSPQDPAAMLAIVGRQDLTAADREAIANRFDMF